MTAGIAQCTSTTQRGEGIPTQPSAVLSMPQFGSKMKYQTMATAAPESTVGVNSTVRAAFRKRSCWLRSSASSCVSKAQLLVEEQRQQQAKHERAAHRAHGEGGGVEGDLPEAATRDDRDPVVEADEALDGRDHVPVGEAEGQVLEERPVRKNRQQEQVRGDERGEGEPLAEFAARARARRPGRHGSFGESCGAHDGSAKHSRPHPQANVNTRRRWGRAAASLRSLLAVFGG